jgi:hypothetical protein
MSKSLNPRVETELKRAIEEYAGADRTISQTAADLIKIGIGVRESGIEPEIKGPFGLPRPFAKVSLSDQMTDFRTEIDEETHDELIENFSSKPNTAAREAIRLGVFTVAGDQFEIEGPEGGPRPFADIEVDSVDDPEVRELIEELR